MIDFLCFITSPKSVAIRATPETSSGQVPELGSGQAFQSRALKVKNKVGALATSIIEEPKAFSIAEFGFNMTLPRSLGLSLLFLY